MQKRGGKIERFCRFSIVIFGKEETIFDKAVWTKGQKNGTLKNAKNKRKEEEEL